MVKVRVMTSYIKYTPEVANDWKQTQADVQKDFPHQFRRTLDATTTSQLQSKLWLSSTLLDLELQPKKVAVLGGWYASYLVELLITELGVEFIHNYEIDEDTKTISYKFNKRHKDTEKYACSIRDIMFKSVYKPLDPELKLGPPHPLCQFDMVVNCSCEHMFPMSRFHDLNKRDIDPIYVLQSTNEDMYDDHINCVSSPKELADQAGIDNPLYSGELKLDNEMTRFMIVGKNDSRRR